MTVLSLLHRTFNNVQRNISSSSWSWKKRRTLIKQEASFSSYCSSVMGRKLQRVGLGSLKKRFSGFGWKDVPTVIVDEVLFKVVYVAEAVVLVGTLCFFFLCCGCHL